MATPSHTTLHPLAAITLPWVLSLMTACSQQFETEQIYKHDPNTIRITAVGDIMLGGTSEPVLEEMGYDYAFSKTKHLLHDSDIVIGNLEGPLTSSDTPFIEKEYIFKSPPEKVAPALKNAGFTLMNLANNHSMDFGIEGINDTIKALRANNIDTIGTGANLQQARQGKVLRIKNKRVGFLSYSLTFPDEFWATDTRPGTAFGHEHQIREDVRRLKKKADIVVVSFHWGQEKITETRDYQPLLAHAAIDEGADLILGHHPHVLQAIEQYKDGIILYSLGNYTFGSYSPHAATSVVASINFRQGNFETLELTPINVLNVDVNFQPRALDNEDAQQVIRQLNELSETTQTQLIYVSGKGFLHSSNDVFYRTATLSD
ncbi:MAG TPA: CapA family protein [Gammaproteobacteria bacterium]